MSDTPLTDAIVQCRNTEDFDPFVHLAVLSRRLELDCAKLTAALEDCVEALEAAPSSLAYSFTPIPKARAILAKVKTQETTK